MKRKININNYEEFFIDYLDGNLSEEEIFALEDFLVRYPDLREELEGLENSSLSPENIFFPDPENLKQIDLSLPVNSENFDFFSIAALEGDLNEEQKTAFNEYLKDNPEKGKDHQIIANTYLDKDEKLIYNEKNNLKRSVFVVYKREFMSVAAIAAGIALLLTVWSVFSDNPEFSPIASYEEEKTTTEVTDTASTNVRVDENVQKEGEKSKLKIPEKTKKAAKNAANTISFKSGVPIASIAPDVQDEQEIPATGPDRNEILQKINIDTELLGRMSPVKAVSNDPLIISAPVSRAVPTKIPPDPKNYLSLQEFAVQKLSDIIFNDNKKELNVINVASKGIEKINTLAGTNMQLEASAIDASDKKILSFNSKLISFSTPINRED